MKIIPSNPDPRDSGRTVKQAHDDMWEILDAGKPTNCECCGRYIKIHQRHINRGMATGLVRMWQTKGFDFVHVPSLGRESSEESKLVHWGLIEEEKKVRKDGGRAGYWRVTEGGRKYIYGELRCPEFAVLGPRNEFFEYRGPFLGIEDVKDFNLHELLHNWLPKDES